MCFINKTFFGFTKNSPSNFSCLKKNDDFYELLFYKNCLKKLSSAKTSIFRNQDSLNSRQIALTQLEQTAIA